MAEEETILHQGENPAETMDAVKEEPTEQTEKPAEVSVPGTDTEQEETNDREKIECCEEAKRWCSETTQTLSGMQSKIDGIAEAVERNGKTVDCILSRTLSSPTPACVPNQEEKKCHPETMQAITELSDKTDAVLNAVNQNAKSAENIMSEATALHRLYQNELAGRIRNMQTELDKYQKRDAGLAFDGIYREIGQIYVDFEDLGDGVEDPRLKKHIGYLLDELIETLAGHGVEQMKSEINTKRNLSLTQVVERIDTDDPTLDGKIARSRASGFYIENRCLIKEMVDVYRYKAPAVQETPTAEVVPEEPANTEETLPTEQGSDNN